MAGWSVKGGSFDAWRKAILKAGQSIERSEDVLEEVVWPAMQVHIDAQFKTGGRHGGEPWDFSGEPTYKRTKAARHGQKYADLPMLVPPRDAQLLPSLINEGHPMSLMALRPGQLAIGTRLEYASALLETGGVGPYGERFPARDPYVMTPAQAQQLDDDITDFLARTIDQALPT